MRMASIGLSIWMLDPQLVELFGKEVSLRMDFQVSKAVPYSVDSASYLVIATTISP